MKINKIHIISFGGLKNYTLDLKDGFNCIYGENEKGKTTIMSFIKMMFYGNEKGGSQLSKNIRKKYTPWDSSLMAGSIEFEKNGRAYRLEREFKTSNSTDKVSITDLSLGEKRPASATIGEELFGLSSSAFERSFFIGQLGFPESNIGAESELNAKLSNMVSTGDESISLDEVVSKLEKVRYSIISKSGKAGEYYKNSLTANNLKAKLDESITANNRFSEGKEKLTAYKAETEKIIQKAYSLKQQLSKEADIKNAEKLRELLNTKEILENLKKESTLKNGLVADDNFLRNLKFLSAKFENAKAKRKAKEKETEIIKNQLDVLINGPKIGADESAESIENTLQQLYTNLKSVETSQKESSARLETLNSSKNEKKKSINPLLIIGIIMIILGALGYLISPIITASLGVIGIILSVFGLTLKSNKKAELLATEIVSLENVIKNQQTHIDDIKSQIADKKAKIEAIKLANTSNAQIVSAQQNLLITAEGELLNLKNDEAIAEAEFKAELQKIDGEYPDIIAKLENSCQKQKELKQQINFLLRDLNNISYEDARTKLDQMQDTKDLQGVDFAFVKAEYERLLSEITERKSTEAAVEAQLKSLISGTESPDVLQDKLCEISKILTAQKDFCDCADIAAQVLKESFAELRQNYGSQLEKKAAEIFSLLTNGKYCDMTVSKSFSINVSERSNPISREAEYLSSGTFDQAYLSVRLAVAELIEENIPLFLDDTLTQYDETRANKTLEFLKEYSKGRQAVMFTCHKTICDFAENLNCNTVNL